MEKTGLYEELVKEISQLQTLIKMYNDSSPDLPKDFNYFKAIKRLSYLRNRKRQIPKKKE